MKSIMFTFLLFFLLVNANVAYASPQFNTEEFFEINGSITYEVRQKFIKALPKIKYLVLNSKGGIIEYSYQIASLVRMSNVTTVIPAGSVCESACTVIFQAGNNRIIHKYSRLMYHGMRYRQVNMQEYFEICPEYPLPEHCKARYESMREYIKQETLRYFDTLERYGASKDLFQRFVKQPIDPQWLQTGNLTAKQDLQLNAQEALDYNIATEVIE